MQARGALTLFRHRQRGGASSAATAGVVSTDAANVGVTRA